MADVLIAVADLKSFDREALESIIAQQQVQLATEQQTRISRDSEIEHLKLVIAKLQRMIFGKKSEKVTHEIEQLELKLEELESHESELIAQVLHRTPQQDPSQRGDRCQSNCRAKCTRICQQKMRVPSAAAHYTSWAKMSPRSLSASPPPTR